MVVGGNEKNTRYTRDVLEPLSPLANGTLNTATLQPPAAATVTSTVPPTPTLDQSAKKTERVEKNEQEENVVSGWTDDEYKDTLTIFASVVASAMMVAIIGSICRKKMKLQQMTVALGGGKQKEKKTEL